MPIKVYPRGERDVELAWLGDDEWELPTLLQALATWVHAQGEPTRRALVADVGFSPRPGAAGGGAVLDARTLGAMAALDMDLHLSEYPAWENESEPPA